MSFSYGVEAGAPPICAAPKCAVFFNVHRGAGLLRMRPFMKDLKKIANQYGWNGSDVILRMTSPTTLFADERRLFDHLTNRPFEDQAGVG